MSNVVVAKNLTKSYRLYSKSSDRLKEALHPFRRSYHVEHFALRNLNLVVRKGEMIGIIGRNGAGKSTLLKILTRVLYPTSGEIEVHGRIASLLELGAGFNPELTGKENIYFFGLLSGMTREEIDKKLDQIIEFADIGPYIDQPVKSFSSGMFVRLAFSAAIHTDPEVLIVDEALSVGDAKFQRKCYSKINDLKAKQTTILLVSHDLDSIKKHCSRALLIEAGHVLFDGEPKDAIMRYFDILYPNKVKSSEVVELTDQSQQFVENSLIVKPELKLEVNNFGHGGAKVENIIITPVEHPHVVEGGRPLNIRISFRWEPDVIRELLEKENLDKNISVGLAISDKAMNYVFGCNTFDGNLSIDPLARAHAEVELKFDLPYLREDDYFVTLAVALGNQKNHVQLKWYDGVIHLKVRATRDVYGVLALDYSYKLLE